MPDGIKVTAVASFPIQDMTTTEAPDLPPVADPTTQSTPSTYYPTEEDSPSTDNDYSTTESDDFSTTESPSQDYDSTTLTPNYDSTTGDYSTIDDVTTTESTGDGGTTTESTGVDSTTTESTASDDDSSATDYPTISTDPTDRPVDSTPAVTTEEPTTEDDNPCPLGTYGNVPHPELCNSFYLCVSGVAVPLQCAAGFEFDPEQKTCVVIAPGGCTLGDITEIYPTTVETTTNYYSSSSPTEGVTPPDRCTDGMWGNIAHEYRCDAFYMCAAGNAIPLFCSDGFEFDPTTSECVLIAEGGCTYNTTTTTPEPTTLDPISSLCPPGIWGNVPHPEICNSFYMCAGTPIQLFCSEGYEFDPVTRQCVAMAEGGCTYNQGTTSGNGETTTILTTVGETDSTTVSSTVGESGESDSTPASTTLGELDSPPTSTTLGESDSSPISTTVGESDSTTTSTTLGDSGSSTLTSTEEDETTAETTTVEAASGEAGTTKLPVTDDGGDSLEDPFNPCPLGVFGNVPHPDLCNVYFLCLSGNEPIELNCPDGLEFDPETRQCVLIAEGGCTLSSITTTTPIPTVPSYLETTTPRVTTTVVTPAPICPLGVFGNVPHPELCNSFYMCAGGTPIQLFCSEGFEFDPETRGCVRIAEGGCTFGATTTTELPPPTTPAPICPPGVWGNVAHPDRCDSFYMCAAGSAIQLNCSAGFEFDPEIRNCVAIAEGGCTLGSQTTPAIQTTTRSPDESTELTTEGESSSTEDNYEVTTVRGSDEEQEEYTTERGSDESEVSETTESTSTSTTHGSEETTASYENTGSDETTMSTTESAEKSTELEEETTEPADHTTESTTRVDFSGEVTESTTKTIDYTETESSTTASFETTKSPDQTTEVSGETTEVSGETTEVSGETTEVSGETTDSTDKTTEVSGETTDSTNVTTESSNETTEPSTTESSEISEAPNTTPAPICPAGVFGNVPHPTQCNAFYLCTAGVPISLQCSAGYEYDPELRTCVVIAEGGCTLGQSSTTTSIPIETTTETEEQFCPPGVFGNIAHPGNCISFYMCAAGQAVLLTCSEGREFDPVTQDCVVIADGGCTLGPNTGSTPGDDESTAPHPQPETSTSTIEQTTTTEEPTPTYRPVIPTSAPDSDESSEPDTEEDSTSVESTETTSESTNTTPVSEETTAESAELTTPAPICPPGVFGNVAHPEKCDSFFICTGVQAIERQCAEGQEFDPLVQNCILITEGGCTLGQGNQTPGEDSGSSESEITTPAPNTTPEVTTTSKPEDLTSDAPQTTSEATETTLESAEVTTPAPICPPGVFGNVAHPDKCDSFFICTGVQAIERQCAEGQEFNPVVANCVLITEGGCTLSQDNQPPGGDSGSSESEITTPAPNTTPEVTTTSIPADTTTEVAQTTSEAAQTTSEATQTTLESAEVTTPAPICPPGVFGNVAHPDKCDSFFICTGVQAIERQCAEGQEFNPLVQNCVLITEGGCTLGQGNQPPGDDSGSSESGITTPAPNTTPEVTTTSKPADTTTEVAQTTSEAVQTTSEATQTTSEAPQTTSEATQTTLESAEVTTPAPICPPGVFGNVAHPDKCDSFFICTGVQAIERQCAEGQEFNPVVANCVLITEGGCTLSQDNQPPGGDSGSSESEITTPAPNTTPEVTTTSIPADTTTEVAQTTSEAAQTTSEATQTTLESAEVTTPAPICPPGVFGNVAHPDKCDSFFICTGVQAIERQCAEGQEFNPLVQNCVLITEGGCTLGQGNQPPGDDSGSSESGITTPAPNTTPEVTTTSKPADTTTEVAQTTSEAAQTTSEATQTTSEAPQTTSEATQTTLEIAEVTTPAPICPPGVFGNVAHPDKCDSFFICTGVQAIERQCAEGQEFNPVVANCVLIAEGGCTLGQDNQPPGGDSGSSESEITTPAPNTTPEVTTTSIPADTTTEVAQTTSEATQTTSEATQMTSEATQTTLESAEVTTPAPICPPGVFGNVAHPDKCDSFFICTGVQAIERQCAEGQEFEPLVQNCVLIAEGGCTLGPVNPPGDEEGDSGSSESEITTPAPNTTPDVTTISKPVDTTSEVTQTTSEATQTTLESAEVTTPAPICPPGVFGNVAHPDKCDSFFICTGVQAIERQCAEGQEFEPLVQNCVLIAEGGCTLGPVNPPGDEEGDSSSSESEIITPTSNTTPEVTTTQTTLENEEATTSAPICPPGVFGNVAHPDKCDLFFICTGVQAIERQCAEGQEFNPVVANCVLIAEGGCTLGQNTATTPKDTDGEPNSGEDLTTTKSPNSTPSPANPEEPKPDPSEEKETTAETPTTVPGDTESVTTTKDSTSTETESTPSVTTPAPICLPGTFGNVANPDNCQAFYMCTGGMAIPLMCTDGYEFDVGSRSCIAIAEGGCTLGPNTGNDEDANGSSEELETATAEPVDESAASEASEEDTAAAHFECPDNQNGNVADPARCDAFYDCSGNIALHLLCADGYEFNSKSKMCIEIAPGGCTTSAAVPTTVPPSYGDIICPNGVTGNLPNEQDCVSFYFCLDAGYGLKMYCAAGNEFDPELDRCVPIAEGGCTHRNTDTTSEPTTEATTIPTTEASTTEAPTTTESTTTPEMPTIAAPICPPGMVGNLPDPNSCEFFYRCIGAANPWHVRCPTGFEYKNSVVNCVPIEEGGCTLGTTAQKALPIPSEETNTTSVVLENKSTSEHIIEENEAHKEKKLGDIACPIGVYGNVPDPESCKSYYFCAGGFATQLHCSQGFEFDPDMKTCVHTSNSKCKSKLKEKTI